MSESKHLDLAVTRDVPLFQCWQCLKVPSTKEGSDTIESFEYSLNRCGELFSAQYMVKYQQNMLYSQVPRLHANGTREKL